LAWLQISHDDLADWRTPMQEVLDAV
jgi:hypothetical protein